MACAADMPNASGRSSRSRYSATSACDGSTGYAATAKDNGRRIELWHAALNGRGRYIPSQTASDLGNAFKSILQTIQSESLAGAVSIAANTPISSLDPSQIFFHRSAWAAVSSWLATASAALGAVLTFYGGYAGATPLALPLAGIVGAACAHELAQQGLTVIFVVLNDSALGMVKHGQRLAGAEQVAFELPDVNYAALAEAMGIPGVVIHGPDDFERLDMDEILQRQGPTLLDVHIDPEEVPPMGLRMQTLEGRGASA